MKTTTIGLTATELTALFPFHIVIDTEMRVVQFGASLARLCPQAERGKALAECYTIHRPMHTATFEAISRRQKMLFLLKPRDGGTVLRGQMMAINNGKLLVFLGSPWVTNVDELSTAGLSLSDFAVHDPISDMLLLLRSERTALADSVSLAEQLEAQRAELLARNYELQQTQQRYRNLLTAADRQTREMTLLEQVRSALAIETELAQMFRTVVEAISRAFGYTLVSLFLREGDELVPQHQAGHDRLLARVPLGQGIIGRVAHTGKAELLEDVHSDPHYIKMFPGIRSKLCVPLHNQNAVVGVLDIESTEEHPLTLDDLRLMTTMGEQIDIAISRAWLFTEARRERDFNTALVDTVGSLVVVIDRLGRIVRFNQSCERITSYSFDEVRGQQLWDRLCPPEETNAAQARVAALASGELPEHDESYWLTRSGERRLIAWSYATLRDATGQPEYLIGTGTDITAQRAAAAALRQSEKKYRDLVDNSQGLICAHDLDGVLRSINPTSAVLLGYAPEEMIGHNLSEFLTREAQQYFGDYLRQVTTQQIANGQLHIRTKGGDTRILLYRNVLHAAPDETPYVMGYGQDITDLKRAEAALSASEAILRSFYDSTPLMMGVVELLDDDIVHLSDNKASAKLFGRTQEQMHNQRASAMGVPPPQLTLWIKNYRESQRRGGPMTFEYKNPAGGMTRWFSATVCPISTSTDQCPRFSYVVDDTTAAKMAEAALRDSEARHRTLIEQLPAIIYTADLDAASTTRYISPQIKDIMGFTPEEWIADPALWLNQIHPEDRPLVLSDVSHTHKSGESVSSEYRAFTRDGQLVWLRDTSKVVRDAHNNPLFLQGLTIDITERRQAEEMRARLAAIVDSSGDAIISLGIDSRVTSWNSGAERMFGYCADEVTGRSIMTLVPFAQRSQHSMFYDEFSHNNTVMHDETLWEHKDGHLLDVALTISPIQSAGGVGGFAVIARDITERKVAETELAEARDAALESSRLKSEFLATMSHEIRTPMNGVIGMSELLIDTPLDEVQREFAETIHSSAHALLTIINDILDFSKIEAGRMSLDIGAMSLTELLASVMSLMSGRARSKALALTTEIGAQVPVTVLGDTGRLRQVLLNLVGNAIKFTHSGSVTIRVDAEHIEDDTLTLRFSVRDTGIGIPASAQQRMFQPFTQADGSVTRKYGGTGLGLAISRSLVVLMGGAIGFESVEGQGTEFWFTARFSAAIDAPAPSRAPVAELPGEVKQMQGHVLLVEDNPVNVQIALRQLQRLGFTADVAENGRVAVERVFAADQHYQLVLMDCHMPEMDGFTATRNIRARETGPGLPIVAMTASALKNDRDACLQAGMNDFLAKPVQLAELQRMLNRWTLPAPTPVPAAAPAAPPTDASLIDLRILEELRSFDTGDVHMFDELMRTYQEEVQLQLSAIHEALANNDLHALAQAAHRLRGSSAYFGAARLANLCTRLEHAGNASEQLPARALAGEVVTTAAHTLQALETL